VEQVQDCVGFDFDPREVPEVFDLKFADDQTEGPTGTLLRA
jgi:hypothetical protein